MVNVGVLVDLENKLGDTSLIVIHLYSLIFKLSKIVQICIGDFKRALHDPSRGSGDLTKLIGRKVRYSEVVCHVSYVR